MEYGGTLISILILTVGMTSGMLFFAMVIGFIYLFIFGCGIAILIGMGMCLGAPNENERIKMIVSSAAHIIALVIAIGGGFLIGYSGIDDPPAYVGLQMAISGLSQVLSLVGTIYFTLFFRQVGSNVANARLTKSAKSALRWFLTFSIGTLLIFVMPMVVVPSNGLEVIFGVLAIFLLITAIGTLLSQLAMIRNGIAALTLPSGNSKLA